PRTASRYDCRVRTAIPRRTISFSICCRNAVMMITFEIEEPNGQEPGFYEVQDEPIGTTERTVQGIT
ncbi:MAG: hypothetical protein ACREBC_32500, partial [Pyrinomonadaceae bacterium]